jgi:hypothetical protein
LDVLDDDCYALADTDAHGRHSVAAAGATQVVDEGGEDAGARAAEGVADGDGATLRVDDRAVEVGPLGEAGQALGGEGLVELDGGEVAPAQTGAARPGPRSPARCREVRLHPARRTGHAGQRRRAGALPPSSEASTSADAPSFIGDVPSVTVPPERKTGSSEASLRGRVRADALVPTELAVAGRHHLRVDQPSSQAAAALVEPRRTRPLLPADRELVGQHLAPSPGRWSTRSACGVGHAPAEGRAPQLLVTGR